MSSNAIFHLPGLFEFYEFYKVFLPLFFAHREYFFDWCEIGSVYGTPADCLWGGGRVGFGDADANDVIELMNEFNISSRLTFSNSLLKPEHLNDKKCNNLCKLFSDSSNSHIENGVIVFSDLLVNYLKERYPSLYLVSSTTKVITDFKVLIEEINRDEFRYVVPDFRLNKHFEELDMLNESQKDKLEFLCNECCSFTCGDRKKCYESVSKKSLGIDDDHFCKSENAKEGYVFSKAMENPGFIGYNDIISTYLPMGFSNFKIEGRGLGSAYLLEFLLYYMTKPEYHLIVREQIYLDHSLDLF